MGGTQTVVDFTTTLRWHDLPEKVKEVIHLAMLDTLGATLAGTMARISDISADVATRLWSSDKATILLHDRCTSAAGAAFANGNTANALDIDDCALYTKGHPGAQILPAALAVAEALGRSGKEMLTAMVVGYELAHRAARIWHETHDVYQACGSWGSVACAGVAAKLMGLSAEQTWHALGIADYHAPNLPMMRDIDHPGMVKHGIGWGAMNGVISAELAAAGYTGIPSLFGMEEYGEWVEDIGTHYIMADGISWKRYACCAWDHAALRAAEHLQAEHAFTADDIDQIRIESFHEAYRLGTKQPETTEEAQFTMAWPVAAHIIDGRIGPQQILEARFDDPQVQDLVSRVELVETPELNRLSDLAQVGDPEGMFASKMQIRLKDGRNVESGYMDSGIEFPQTTWDKNSLEEKFRWLTGYVLDDERIDRLVDMVGQFEDVGDVRELTEVVKR